MGRKPIAGRDHAFLSFWIVRETILESKNPEERSMWLAPILAFPTFFVLGLALQFKALKGLFSRLDDAGTLNKSEWLGVKESGSFNPFTPYCPEGVNLVDYPDCAGASMKGHGSQSIPFFSRVLLGQ